MDADVQYGNLIFTPYFDPFATVALKQEETHGDIFEEIDNYPSNLVTSVPADANQTHPAGSSNQAVEPPAEGGVLKSTGEQGKDSDDLPSYLVNSFTVSFTYSQLWDIKEYFSIPGNVGIGVPVEGKSIMAPIVNEKDIEGAFCPG
ncbi:hypothetical protein LIER_41729 [Lithospermum erythrorhizon]|uniref:Uncharacterized protein n=1 Tax=Lithospermum erythrorhizon TaxID=34254 RepID=A0AAV3RFN9_LITER